MSTQPTIINSGGSIMKRAMLIIATLASLVWFTPLAAEAGTGCRGADAHEHGASDIVGAVVVYEDNAIEPTTVALDPRMTVKVELGAPSCEGITYSVEITDPANGDRLGFATRDGDGSQKIVLLDAAVIAAPSNSGDSVNVKIWTSSARSEAIDVALGTAVDGGSGGQGYN